ncbi:MAG: hypothetical protein QOI15_211 [Pseudonocardiales bacterium]|nr:hypothetical protein [Pseudonocardiales bacterium]MDT4919309.1 hypothetical protein [Pseudonocardiales bacterium]
MQRKSGTAVIAALLAAAAVGLGSLIMMQNVAGATSATSAVTTASRHVVMQASAELTSGVGLKDVKLFDATTNSGKLSGRFAVSSVTVAQAGGSQAIEVSLRAATCDNSNAFGAVEYIVVPQDETVHISYPSAVRMPFTASAPTSWCLYAETVRDNGTLHVSVVATSVG